MKEKGSNLRLITVLAIVAVLFASTGLCPQEPEGKTPLSIATEAGSTNIVELLKANGAK
ncbi:MAG TPA: hypothetical protein VFC41_04560 [Anaerovoracaceae bacterium]|nr:hypothetical protein [Anaerovoracaceae bacterium]